MTTSTVTHTVEVRRIGVAYNRWFRAYCTCGEQSKVYRTQRPADFWAGHHRRTA